MTLTSDDLTILKKPFAVSEHEFLNGNAYIREWAICDRIEEVDPAWTFERLAMDYRASDAERGMTRIVATFRLTINGVSRDGVGMSDVSLKKDGSSESNEAEKSAATDALKRCARLFGVGRYLLMLGSDVKDERSLQQWFSQQNGKVRQMPQTGGLTQQDAKKLVEHWQGQAVTTAQILQALGVERLGQFAGTYDAANARIKVWLDAQLDGKPVPTGATS